MTLRWWDGEISRREWQQLVRCAGCALRGHDWRRCLASEYVVCVRCGASAVLA